MEEIHYNILWIDDEHEKLSGTKGRAKRNGINLIPFKSLNGGMSELENNCHLYDGVLLDAKFFENENDEAESEDTDFVHRAKERLLQLPKKFELFILTGQAEAYEDRTFKKVFKNVYEKGKDDDIERLFVDLKEAAKNQLDTQIKHKYHDVFQVCTEEYIGLEAQRHLLAILKSMYETENKISDELYFNKLRIIIEWMFRAANQVCLLDDKCIENGRVNLNASSRFLSGLENNTLRVKCKEKHFPKYVSDSVHRILTITNIESHTADSNSSDNIGLNEFRQIVDTPYILYSLTYQLMDVLIWFKKYVDENSDKEINKSHWIEY